MFYFACVFVCSWEVCCFHDVVCFHPMAVSWDPARIPRGTWSPAPCSPLSGLFEGLLTCLWCWPSHWLLGPFMQLCLVCLHFSLPCGFPEESPIPVSHTRDVVVLSLLTSNMFSACFSSKAGRSLTWVQKRIEGNSTEFILEHAEGVELGNVASTWNAKQKNQS